MAAIPAARATGVCTPGVLAFDDAQDILPVPYLIVERIHGRSIESLDVDPVEYAAAWRHLGADLARLHTAEPSGPAAGLDHRAGEDRDVRELLDARAHDGWLSPVETRWVARWLRKLEPAVSHPLPDRLVHGDVQMSNVLVATATGAYLALVDWGCARWDDDTLDFVSLPMRAVPSVPSVLAGHREIAPTDDDESKEARIVWRRLHLILSVLPRGAAPHCSWGERPVAWFADLVRFFVDPPGRRWRAVGPPP